MKIIGRLRKLPRRALGALGYQLYSANIRWPIDEGFNEARRRISSRKIKGIPDDRCFTLYRLAQAMADLPGDLIECGSRNGKSTRFLLAGTGISSDKMIHVFDSFEGVSEPGRQDMMTGGRPFWARGDLATPETVFLNNMQMYEHMVRSYKGWIPDRFAEIADQTFNLAHIDVDLYQPTRDSLEFIYGRMVKGGVIVCDDYGSISCPGARRAFDEFFEDKPEAVLEMPTLQAIVVKG